MSTENQLQPIFKPLKAKFQPLGIPATKAIGIVICAFMGFVLAAVLGNWKQTIDKPYTANERAAIEREYESLITQVASVERHIAQSGMLTSDANLNQTQKDLLQKARDLGISSNMTSEQLLAAVPKSRLVQEEVIPAFWRFMLFPSIPIFIGVVLFFDAGRTCLYSELKRLYAYSLRQKQYMSYPLKYIDKKMGTHLSQL